MGKLLRVNTKSGAFKDLFNIDQVVKTGYNPTANFILKDTGNDGFKTLVNRGAFDQRYYDAAERPNASIKQALELQIPSTTDHQDAKALNNWDFIAEFFKKSKTINISGTQNLGFWAVKNGDGNLRSNSEGLLGTVQLKISDFNVLYPDSDGSPIVKKGADSTAESPDTTTADPIFTVQIKTQHNSPGTLQDLNENVSSPLRLVKRFTPINNQNYIVHNDLNIFAFLGWPVGTELTFVSGPANGKTIVKKSGGSGAFIIGETHNDWAYSIRSLSLLHEGDEFENKDVRFTGVGGIDFTYAVEQGSGIRANRSSKTTLTLSGRTDNIDILMPYELFEEALRKELLTSTNLNYIGQSHYFEITEVD